MRHRFHVLHMIIAKKPSNVVGFDARSLITSSKPRRIPNKKYEINFYIILYIIIIYIVINNHFMDFTFQHILILYKYNYKWNF